MKLRTQREQLLAPCGMDCATCSHYLARANGVAKRRGSISHCTGCRPRNKQCAYLKGQCLLLAENKIQFCFQCRKYPCERLRKFDSRYRTTYSESPIGNLEQIRAQGPLKFIEAQQKKHACPDCGGMISIHNRKCFRCDQVTHWKE